jgi:hypothetical protein
MNELSNKDHEIVDSIFPEDKSLKSGDLKEIRVDSTVQSTIDRYNELRDEVRESKKDFLVMFGIFASFVTFLSVEIQIFKTLTSFWLLIGLSSFLLAGILIFALTLGNIAKNRNEWKDFYSPTFIILYILLIFSFISFYIYLK